jgi:hypothetical protein
MKKPNQSRGEVKRRTLQIKETNARPSFVISGKVHSRRASLSHHFVTTIKRPEY